MKKKALVLLSGGLDSTTCLMWAREKFGKITALLVDYGQRHKVELTYAREIAARCGVPVIDFKTDVLQNICDSALVNTDLDVNSRHSGNKKLPASFVPGRNILFLTIAASIAYREHIENIVIGANAVDYSGYPDCRTDFLCSMQLTLFKGLDREISILAPLVNLNKVEIIRLGDELGEYDFIRNNTHSCYNGVHDKLHPYGYGCGKCDSCRIRKEAYQKYAKWRKVNG